MKTPFFRILITLCFALFLNSCESESNNDTIKACGVSDPAKNLPWLAEFIETAKTDKTGKYYGVMWLEQYNGQDVFVAEMALSGAAYLTFDCEGNPVYIEEPISDFFNKLKKNIVIYVHPDYSLNL
jgi:hypothetical protein